VGSVVKKEVKSQKEEEEEDDDLSKVTGSMDDGLSLTTRIKVKNTTTTTTVGMEEINTK
jgi:hypothetical protein